MSYLLPFEINIYCFHIVLHFSVALSTETSEALRVFSVASQPQRLPWAEPQDLPCNRSHCYYGFLGTLNGM